MSKDPVLEDVFKVVNKEKLTIDVERINKLISACMSIINNDKLIDKSFRLNDPHNVTFNDVEFHKQIKKTLAEFCEDNSWTEIVTVGKIEHNDIVDTVKANWHIVPSANKIQDGDTEYEFKDGIVDDETSVKRLSTTVSETLKDYMSKQNWDVCSNAIDASNLPEQRKLYIKQKLHDFLFSNGLEEKLAFKKIIDDAVRKNEVTSTKQLLGNIISYCKEPTYLLYLIGSTMMAGSTGGSSGVLQTITVVESYLLSILLTKYAPIVLKDYISSQTVIKALIGLITAFV